MKKKSSGGNLLLTSQNRSISFKNERFRAASPLLNSSRFQFQERIGSPMLFASTGTIPMVDPPGTLRFDNAETFEVSRPRPNQSYIHRDGSGSLSALTSTTYHPVGSVHRGKVSE